MKVVILVLILVAILFISGCSTATEKMAKIEIEASKPTLTEKINDFFNVMEIDFSSDGIPSYGVDIKVHLTEDGRADYADIRIIFENGVSVNQSISNSDSYYHTFDYYSNLN